jgi:hypothetical protein
VEFTEKISALIFALIVMAVVVYIVMSRFVIGPLSGLQRGEQVILVASAVGIVMVIVYAAVELLFYVVF